MPRIRRGSKDMGKVYTLVLFVIYFICLMFFSEAYAATIQAKSCSLTDVRNAVNEASRGDTVVVPPGSCNWNDTVTIQKAITLQGSGSDSTLIISKFEANGKVPGYPFVRWKPSPLDKSYVFRVTGFQFDSQNFTAAFRVDNSYTTFTPSLRIDNNRFINTARLADSPSTEPWETRISMTMMFFGLVKGVIDNNYFSGKTVIQARRGNSAWTTPTVTSWDNGTDDNVFFEDNYFYRNDSMNQVVLSGAGGSFVARYNTFDCTLRAGYFYSADTHGAQPGPSFSGFGAEMYGNKIIAPNATGQRIAELRGGIHKVFYNKSISSVKPYITLWETYSPTYSKTSTRYTCPAGSLYVGTSTCSIDGRGQNVEKSYFWNNLYGTSGPGSAVVYNNLLGTNPYPDPSVTKAKALRENFDFWLPQTSFNGKHGVGCGPLANRPTTCTEGVGYWATNQSCTEVADDSLGANPRTPIQGILYRCESANKWTTYYTPYKYPHPLRSNDPEPTDPETISAPKGFKLVN